MRASSIKEKGCSKKVSHNFLTNIFHHYHFYVLSYAWNFEQIIEMNLNDTTFQNIIF